MSKPISVAAFISSLFGKSHKTISEKLSTDEFNEFSEDASELNNRLEAQTAANALVVADLATANASIAELTTNLATANANLTTANTQLTAVTTERDKYKAHWDKSADKGNNDGGEDDNSRKAELSSYNQNALDEWNRTHAKA